METLKRFSRFWLCCSLVLLWSGTSWADSFTDRCGKYDPDIKRVVRTYWIDLNDYRWWRAQVYQESRCNPDARSPVGAMGIAQTMPGTFKDLIRLLGYPGTVSPHDARIGLEAGAVYQAQRRMAWGAAGRTTIQRNDLGAASYNAGMGHILKAQKACANARQWPEIAVCLPQITGPRNAHETTDYVAKIHRWYKQMEVQ